MNYCIPYLSNVAISAFEMKKRCKTKKQLDSEKLQLINDDFYSPAEIINFVNLHIYNTN